MARKFYYICAGMFLLALSYHLGASSAGAQTAGFASPTEVAVLRGALNPGETVPLPTLADGTTARESECQWIVSLANDNGGAPWCYTADTYFSDAIPANEEGAPQKAFLDAHRGRVVNSGQNVAGTLATVNYLIIATRGAARPTPALHESWGQVKARYRSTPGMTVTPGADNK